jgi:hypothetical protein
MYTNNSFFFIFFIVFFFFSIVQIKSASLPLFPYPQNVKQGISSVVVSSNFQIFTSSKSQILVAGIKRYQSLIFPFHEKNVMVGDALNQLQITVNSDDESLQLGVVCCISLFPFLPNYFYCCAMIFVLAFS